MKYFHWILLLSVALCMANNAAVFRGIVSAGQFKIGHPAFADIGQKHILGLFLNEKPIQTGFQTSSEWLDYIYDPANSYLKPGYSGIAVFIAAQNESDFLCMDSCPRIMGFDIIHAEEDPLPLEKLWDQTLQRRLAKRVRPLWAYAGPVMSNENVFTQFLTDPLAKDFELAVRGAIETGAVFASNGPEVVSITVTNATLAVSFKEPCTILWLKPGQLAAGTEVLQKDSGVASEFSLPADLRKGASFVRFVACRDKTLGFSSPFFISQGKISNPYAVKKGVWTMGAIHVNPMISHEIDSLKADRISDGFAQKGWQAVFLNSYSYWAMQMARRKSDGIPYVEGVYPANTGNGAASLLVRGKDLFPGLHALLGGKNALVSRGINENEILVFVPKGLKQGKNDLELSGPWGKFRYEWAYTVCGPQDVKGTWTTFRKDNTAFYSEKIYRIAQTKNAIWFATNEGISRFYNDRFEHFVSAFNPNKTAHAPGRTVVEKFGSMVTYDAVCAPDNSIWFGTMWGVSRCHPDSGWMVMGDPELKDLPHGEVYALAAGTNGEIYALCKYGPARFRNNQWEMIQGFPDTAAQMADIAVDTGNRLWVACAKRIWLYDDSRPKSASWRSFSHPQYEGPFCLEQGLNKGLLVGSRSGLFRVDATGVFSLLKPGIVTAVRETPEGIFIGTNQGVYCMLASGKQVHIHQGNSNLTCDIVTDIAYINGALWIVGPRGIQCMEGGL